MLSNCCAVTLEMSLSDFRSDPRPLADSEHASSSPIKIHVGIINLLNRTSRRRKILNLAANLKGASSSLRRVSQIESINFMEAVDGVSQSFEQLFERYGMKPFSNWAIEDLENRYPSSWRKPQTSGGIASGLSHLDMVELLSKVSGMGDSLPPVLLILEDDCVLTTSGDYERAWGYFSQCLLEADRHVPDWDMIMLGAAGHRPDISPSRPIGSDSRHTSSVIEYAGFSYLTTMYFISCRGVEKLKTARSVCISHMLAFDELHNALAGLNCREDVKQVFQNCPKLVLLSSKTSLVRQDPHDCVHDTAVSSGSRRGFTGWD
jgi:hypothetical protein